MRWRTLAIAALLPLSVGTWAAVALDSMGPSTEELEADIARVDDQIRETKANADHFAPESLVGGLIRVQLAFLQTTRVMLDQKRLSWLRGIDLSYVVDGKRLGPASPSMVQQYEKQRSEALEKAKAADAKATSMGGLLQTLALVEAQTERVTTAVMDATIASAKLGFAFPAVQVEQSQQAPVSKRLDDKGAL